MGYDRFVRQWILDHCFLTVLNWYEICILFITAFYAAPTLSSPLTIVSVEMFF